MSINQINKDMEEPKKDALSLRIDGIKSMLAKNYQKQIVNFLGDEKQALKFLSGMVSSIQRLPKLAECTPDSLINSFMIMAQMGFMPSAISGEAYILPYENKRLGIIEAQFQLGYQGIVTLLYGAGAKSVDTQQVRKQDVFKLVNGAIYHEINPFLTLTERGEVIGYYAIIITMSGGRLEKYMNVKDIIAFAKRYSKSFGTEFSPWNDRNDLEGWMYRKTVLKQCAKLAPKNEKLNIAIAEDNKDSDIGERMEAARIESEGMTMGAITAPKSNGGKNEPQKNEGKKNKEEPKTQTSDSLPEIGYGEDEEE